MSSLLDPNLAQRASATAVSSLKVEVAANDDHVPGRGAARADVPATGWNAYEVWRRLIKEARERRPTEK